MTEKKAQTTGGRTISELVRRELGSETNRDFLARMPSFRPETEMPERLMALLGELDRAEGTANQAS